VAEQSPSAQSAPAIEEPDGLVCPRCGYDLRAISSENCPECGLPIDRTSISLSRIPWEHCKELGYFRGFWDTTGYAVFHPLQLAKEVYRPISYRRARWFQRIVVLWAWIPTAFWLIAALIPETNSRWDVRVPTITIAVLVLGVSLSLATGIASYWFHPQDPVRIPPEPGDRAELLRLHPHWHGSGSRRCCWRPSGSSRTIPGSFTRNS